MTAGVDKMNHDEVNPHRFSKRKMWALIAELAAILLFVFYASPLILVVFNASKQSGQIILNPLSAPTDWSQLFKNIASVFGNRVVNYKGAFISSMIITFGSLAFIILFSSMAAWVIVRNKTKFSTFIYYCFIAMMVVPFQVVMYPLVSWFKTMSDAVTIPLFGFSLLRSYPGAIFAYIGFGISMSVFMYCGFIKGIPYEIEEAAEIDGCTKVQIFNKIILPMLKPITVTVSILNGIWIWNDFLLPLLILGKGNKIQTIPLAVSNFVGSYVKQWDMILTSTFLAIIPVLIFFLIAQKSIIKGMSEGAVKS